MSGSAGDRTALSVLLLCDDGPGHANTTLDHIAAFERFSRHRIRRFNPRGLRSTPFLDLDEFDVVVVHYSLVVSLGSYLPPSVQRKLERFDGLKIAFLQDEYRWIDEITAALRRLGVGVLYSVAGEEAIPKLYGDRLPDATVVSTLTGFVPESLVGRPTPPLRRRPIDVGYRGRDVPFWLGRFSREKILVGQRFLELSRDTSLRCDIAWDEGSRIYGEAWNRFLASCRATLGSGSGASIADFDGSLHRRVDEYLAEHPHASFEAVHEAILAPYEGNVLIDVVSPRVFEAAALRTALVLFPSPYSGVVRPGEHYLRLEKDFSNFEAVAEELRDLPRLEAMTERAYEELVASGRYSHRAFVEGFDELVEAKARARSRGPGALFGLAYPLARADSAGRALSRRGLHRWRTLPLRARVRAGARAGLALGLVLRDPPLRALLRRYLDERRRAPASLPPPRPVLVDLLKLAVARRLQLGCLPLQAEVAIEPEFDPERRLLRLHSRPRSSERPVRLRATRLRARIAEAGLDEIVWRHGALGSSVPYRLAGVKTVRLELSPAERPVHRFDALPGLYARFPQETLAALEALL